MMKYCYVTFDDLYHALLLEKACKQTGIKGRLVSIPREFSAGCGYAWRMKAEEEDLIREFIEAENLKYLEIRLL